MPDRARSVPRPLILIADDNVDTREMYALHLTFVGYKVATAADGHAAVMKARATHPDLIVMDLHMPRVDGWTAMKELATDPTTQDIPIVILTGHDLKDYLKTAALAVGACSYLRKPVLPEKLEREISERLAERRLRIGSTP